MHEAQSRLWMGSAATPPDTIVPTDGAIARLNRSSLGSRMVLLVLLAVIPLVSLSLLSTANNFALARTDAEALIVQRARALADTIDRDMYDTVQIVKGVASMPAGSPQETFERVRTSVAAARPYLTLGMAEMPLSTLASVTDVVFESPLRRSDPRSAGLSMVITTATSEGLAHSFAVSVSRAHLLDLLMRRKLANGWTGAVIDQSGQIVARNLRNDEFVGTSIVPAVRDGLDARPEGFVRTINVEGVESVIAFARAHRTGFATAVALPAQLLEAPQRREMMVTLIEGAAVTAVAVMLALLLARQISRSLQGVASDLAFGREPRAGASEIVPMARILQKTGLQRNEALDVMREQASNLRQILDSLPVTLLVMNERLEPAFANLRALRDLAARSFHTPEERDRLFHPDDLPRLAETRRAWVGGTVPEPTELRVWIGEAWRWHVVTGVVIKKVNSGTNWIVAMLQDVHDLHVSRAGLVETNELLEARVEQRTSQLSAVAEELTVEMARRAEMQDALLQSQKQEALGQLTGGIAHDVNNVLAVIANSYASIEAGASQADLEENVAIGLRAVDHAAGLVRSLMVFARQQTLTRERVETAAELPAIVELCRHALGRQHVLTLELEPGLGWIEIDRDMLQSALLNLVANARDAMEDGGHIAITARCERAVETEAARSDCRGLRVAIAVRDEGCGMGEGELARATDPFFTTKRARGGSGLGLAMVEGFVAQSGGVLRIESEEACGTVVTLVLPIMDAPEEAAPALEGQAMAVQAAHVTEFAPPVTEKRPARLTILVVDDNALLLSATARLLQTLNHEVLTALDAQEAFTLVEHNERVSVVLSDVSMPGETGVGLAARLALLRPDLPVILMTGFAGDAIDATDRYVLGKPFTRRQLVSALEAAVPDRG